MEMHRDVFVFVFIFIYFTQSLPASDCWVVIFADAVAMYQPEESGKEEVVPELRSNSSGDLPSMLT